MNIKGNTIVVTGASEGIGREIALACAKKGANLALIARNIEGLKETAKQALRLGSPSASIYACNLQDFASIDSAVKKIVSDHPQTIVALVNNAGIWQKKSGLENIPDQEILSVLNTDLTGLIKNTKELIPYLKEQQEAAIINISSRSGITAQEGQAVYTAAKWGVKGFTQVLKEDLKDTSVHLSGVYQGGTNTKMFHKAGETWPQEKLESFIPANELGELVAHLLTLPNRIWLSEVHVENR
jgi:NAD(P)-dependent dehydrogenase (short-subunit alcohol dehydrogenase family)